MVKNQVKVDIRIKSHNYLVSNYDNLRLKYMSFRNVTPRDNTGY